MKKFLLAICAVLATAVFYATPTFAGSGEIIDEVHLSGTNIYVPTAAASSELSDINIVVSEEGAKYDILTGSWVYQDTPSTWSSSPFTTAQNDTHYGIRLVIQINEDLRSTYDFADDVAVTYNGNSTNVSTGSHIHGTTDTFYVYIDLGTAKTIIEEVGSELAGEYDLTPKAGEGAAVIYRKTTEQYAFSNATYEWRECTVTNDGCDPVSGDSVTTFEAGKTYVTVVNYTAMDGYMFAEGVTKAATLDGWNIQLTEVSDNKATITVYYSIAPAAPDTGFSTKTADSAKANGCFAALAAICGLATAAFLAHRKKNA